MNETVRHEIDDTERIKPHVRLCHLMLREGLARGFSALALAPTADGMPTARAQSGPSWEEFMVFPPPLYVRIVAHLKGMAGPGRGSHAVRGTIFVHVAGRDAAIDLEVRGGARDGDELLLTFPSLTAAT